jgi:hypothetical protein
MGTEPFSTSPQIHEQFMSWIDRETMFVACLNNRIVASLALNPAAPSYIANPGKLSLIRLLP